MARLLRDRYLWLIIALIGGAAITAYLVEDYILSRLFFGLAKYEAHLILLILRSGLLLTAVIIAAWRYRFKGGLAAVFAIGLMLLPHIIIDEIDLGVGMLAVSGIGAVSGIAFSWLVDRRKQAEERTKRLSAVLGAVRDVNQLITREKDRDRLIQKSCDLLVQRTDYEKVWVLLLDESRNFVTVASSGFGEDASVFWKQLETGDYPVCLRELLAQEQPFIAYDQPGKQHEGCVLAAEHSGVGVFRCRLEHEGKLYGVIGVSVPSLVVFDHDEQSLFVELCDDIAFALANIDAEGQRKRAEEKLAQLASFPELNPNPVIETNLAGIVTYLNLVAQKQFPDLLTLGSEHPIIRDLMSSIPTLQSQAGNRLVLETKLGDIIYEQQVSYSLEMGSIRSYIVDITQRKQAEADLDHLYQEVKSLNLELEARVRERTEQLEQAVQVAEVASRAKSDFLASMSHELRTPLNAVIGFSQVLQEQYFGKLNEKQAEYITDILEGGQHLLSLINDILDLSKIEAGKVELELSGVKIRDLLEGSLVMIKEKALAHRINLDTHTTAELEGLVVTADERRLKQVMFNLLSNAAKFTPDGGAITIEGKKEGQELIISVSDTGIGIAPEEQEKIFEEFYQVRGGTNDKSSGTGLGLPVSRRIIEMHGGRIWVESEGPGKGSRFVFTLPV